MEPNIYFTNDLIAMRRACAYLDESDVVILTAEGLLLAEIDAGKFSHFIFDEDEEATHCCGTTVEGLAPETVRDIAGDAFSDIAGGHGYDPRLIPLSHIQQSLIKQLNNEGGMSEEIDSILRLPVGTAEAYLTQGVFTFREH